jgi:hypothetical protein
VREGLHKVLWGYAIILGIIVLIALLTAWVVWEAVTGRHVDAIIDAAMLTYFFAGVIFLLGLWSLILVVTGKLRCLINVPERAGAKWMMFVSMLFFAACPTLDFISRMLPSHVTPEQVQAVLAKSPLIRGKLPTPSKKNGDVVMATFNEVRDLSISLALLDSKAYLAMAGSMCGLLSTTFFVLFMRAVAKCFFDVPRQRFTEFYLIYSGVLMAGSAWVFFNPPGKVEELPLLLLLLAGGWLLSLFWYIALIISTSMGIACGVAWRDAALRMIKEAQAEAAPR